MTASPEFDALLATTQLEREKADGIRSLIAASRLAADYQHRAEVAEAALARVEHLNVVAIKLFAVLNGTSGETEDAVVAFITDIRRNNLHVLLMYKAVFELSRDRAEFI